MWPYILNGGRDGWVWFWVFVWGGGGGGGGGGEGEVVCAYLCVRMCVFVCICINKFTEIHTKIRILPVTMKEHIHEKDRYYQQSFNKPYINNLLQEILWKKMKLMFWPYAMENIRFWKRLQVKCT